MPSAGRRTNEQGSRSSRRAAEAEDSSARQRDRVQRTYGGQSQRRQQASGGGKSNGSRTTAADEAEEEEGDEVNEEDDDVDVDSGDEIENDDEEEEDSEGEAGGTDGAKPTYEKLPTNPSMKAKAAEFDKNDIKRKADDVVRLALFCEQRRQPLKRDDIKEKVLQKQHFPIFNIIFNRASMVLAYTFGYELRPLRGAGMDNEQIVATQTQQRKRGRDDGEETQTSRSKGSSRNAWIVTSQLPPKLVQRMTCPNPNLRDVFSGMDAARQPHSEIQPLHDDNGVLLDWKRANSDLGSMGLTFLMLSLILLNQRSLSDDRLRSYIRQLSLSGPKALPTALQPLSGIRLGDKGYDIDEFLNLLVRQHYLERIEVPSAQTSAATLEATLTGRKKQVRGNVRRNRRSGEDETEKDFEWRWGARAEAEISEQAVADFVVDVFVSADMGRQAEEDGLSDEEEEDEDEERRDADEDGEGEMASQRKRQKVSLMRDIEKAAGSALIV